MTSRAYPAPLGRRWWATHVLTLIVVLAVTLVAARGNWFFYDEWDFLASRAEWQLLAPHNGHLSFFPQLATTLVKLLVGLHSYWPFLALTIAAHLLVVHMLWRLLMRSGVHPAIAVALPAVFGVLAPASEDTLWAFQVGFITPIATGVGALLLAMREELRRSTLVGVTVLLLVGVGFASTALPIVVAVCAYLWVRHGWHSVLLPAGSFAVVYGSWYLVFARGSIGADGYGVSSLGQLATDVPVFIFHAFIDSLGKLLPYEALAPALVVAIVVGSTFDLRRSRLRRLDPAYALALAAIGFALLTALTRVGTGVENASTGRYVYIYAALLLPLVGRLLSQLVGRSRTAITVVVLLIMVGFVFNAAGTVQQGRAQAELEQTVNRTISAALSLDDGDPALSERTPAAVVAPTLTMRDIRDFVRRGEYEPVPFTPTDLLSARVNLFLVAEPVGAGAAVPVECMTPQAEWVEIDPETDVIHAPAAGMLGLVVSDGDVQSFGTQIPLFGPGAFELRGLDAPVQIQVQSTSAGGLCVVRGG